MIEKPSLFFIDTSATKAIYSAQMLNPGDYSRSAVIATAITAEYTEPGLVRPAFARDSNGMLLENHFRRAFNRKAIATLLKPIKTVHEFGTKSA